MKILRRDNENFERFLKRFKKNYQEAGIERDYKENEFYQGTKSARKKLKREKNLRKALKRAREQGV